MNGVGHLRGNDIVAAREKVFAAADADRDAARAELREVCSSVLTKITRRLDTRQRVRIDREELAIIVDTLAICGVDLNGSA